MTSREDALAELQREVRRLEKLLGAEIEKERPSTADQFGEFIAHQLGDSSAAARAFIGGEGE